MSNVASPCYHGLRVGVNQGYLTYGAGIKYNAFSFDAAIYGEELDTNPGQLEDTRYIANITIDLEFENNFFSDGQRGWPQLDGRMSEDKR